MHYRNKWFFPLLFSFLGIVSFRAFSDSSADSVLLYTPYTRITVAPGESINYSIDIINSGSELKNLGLSVSGLPKDWRYSLKAGSWSIQQITVLPKERQSLSLTVEVPLKVNKGTYRFAILAGENIRLSLSLTIVEQGTFETAFTAQQANMEGHSKSIFTFNAVLNNRTGEKQLYALRAVTPRGWIVTFKPNYIQATSVEVEPNTTKDIQVEIDPPENVAAGTYLIPVSAVTGATSASLNLEVVITGSFGMELSTPTGLVSSGITAGDQKRIDLVVKNTGSSALTGAEFSAQAPVNWEVTFDPKRVERIEADSTAQVTAIIKAVKRSLAGDYIINIDAKVPEVSSRLIFRISVRTPMLIGWLGILIILAAAGSVYYLFRKYGRR
jgi:uncharacterized membrane protein